MQPRESYEPRPNMETACCPYPAGLLQFTLAEDVLRFTQSMVEPNHDRSDLSNLNDLEDASVVDREENGARA